VSEPLLIIGSGGMAREIVDLVTAINTSQARWSLRGIAAEESPGCGLDSLWLGPIEALEAVAGVWFVVAEEEGETRTRLGRRCASLGLLPATLVHPSATVGLDVRLGGGSVVFPHASLTTNISLGTHVVIGPNATVAHDSTLADGVTLGPGANISGSVTIGAHSTLGSGCNVIERRRIGSGVSVGIGSVVIRDLADRVTAVGIPARPQGS